jgi:heme exporter protein A
MPIQLSTTSLMKSFQRRTIFRDVSFVVEEGQTLLITGKNGSGKSTLAKILSRLLSPTSGTLDLTVNCSHVDELHWNDQIGFVSPYLQLYEEFSAKENLALALSLRGRPPEPQRAGDLLTMVSLTPRAGDPLRAFSSGMKQRTKFAFALMHKPKVLILDEPMTNLDAEGIAMVREIMERQRREGILIVATNDESDVATPEVRVNLDAH